MAEPVDGNLHGLAVYEFDLFITMVGYHGVEDLFQVEMLLIQQLAYSGRHRVKPRSEKLLFS